MLFPFIFTIVAVIGVSGVHSIVSCPQNSFLCGNGNKCITTTELCDFKDDCGDGSDETRSLCLILISLRKTCKISEIFCSSYNQCYEMKQACSSGFACHRTSEHISFCQKIANNKLLPNDEYVGCLREKKQINQINQTIETLNFLAVAFNHSAFNGSKEKLCPPLYVSVGLHCISFFAPAKVTWSEAKVFCESISGHLVILNDLALYKQILDYIKENDLTSNFWIGGFFPNSKNDSSSTFPVYEAWSWLDGDEVEMGAPFWSLQQTGKCQTKTDPLDCKDYAMMPVTNSKGRCMAITPRYFYYFSDQDCYQNLSPLCALAQV